MYFQQAQVRRANLSDSFGKCLTVRFKVYDAKMRLKCYPVAALYEQNQIKFRNADMIKTVFLSGREYCLKASWSSCLKGVLKIYPTFKSIYFYETK